jgi:class 3 adenylate cyclase
VGDSGRTQHLIQTVHGRGYRFVAPVEACRDAPPETGLPTTSSAPCVPEASHPLLPEVAASLPAPALRLPASPAPLLAELSPPRQFLPASERRLVTALYGSLAHATALMDRLGWEAFRQLAQTFRTLAQDCVQRYEGTLQTLEAEGVLALFGVPMAQEEHAWRAVQAALALQQRLREAFAGRAGLTARVGVHTGWVVAVSRHDESRQAIVVGGDTTQGVMHVQALAAPGAVVVSDTTQRLLHATVHSTATGVVQLPGQPAPLMAYTVQGLEAPTGTRVWSPFVGRQARARGLRRPPGPCPEWAGAGRGAHGRARHRQITVPGRMPAAAPGAARTGPGGILPLLCSLPPLWTHRGCAPAAVWPQRHGAPRRRRHPGR